MGANKTAETLALIKAAMQNPSDDLRKAWTQSNSAVSGITAYDLEAGAKQLYPVLTPLRNSIPRTSGKGGIQANWRGITGINTTGMSPGVSQGNRGGVITTSTQDYTAAYKGLGLEDYVTFEADYAAEGFDDVKALAVEGLLRSLMIGEEKVLLGGNNSLALGTTPTPAGSDVTTGGTLLANTAYKVYCVALTLDGYLNSSVAGGITASITRTNADGSTDTYGGGVAQKSAVATVTTANDASDTHQLRMTVTAVSGAVAYGWYWGTVGNELLGAITTINSILISAAATGTQNASALPASDQSRNSLLFDGLLTFAATSANNSYYYKMPTGTGGVGTPLTSDGAGGIVQIDTALKSFWDNYRLSPDEIWVNSQEQNNISAKILAGTANGALRFNITIDPGKLGGGVVVASYRNKFGMNGAVEIPIKLHPYLPPGTILFVTHKLPYPLSNVQNVMQVRARREYYQIEWPMVTRKYQYGVYCDEVLQHYFTPSIGVITNIANG